MSKSYDCNELRQICYDNCENNHFLKVAFDASNCWNELVERYAQHEKEELFITLINVLLLVETNKEKVLDKLMASTSKGKGFIHDSGYIYFIEEVRNDNQSEGGCQSFESYERGIGNFDELAISPSCLRGPVSNNYSYFDKKQEEGLIEYFFQLPEFLRRDIFFLSIEKDEWYAKDNIGLKRHGIGALSLSKQLTGGSDLDALLKVSSVLNISFEKPESVQLNSLKGYKWISNPSVYPTKDSYELYSYKFFNPTYEWEHFDSNGQLLYKIIAVEIDGEEFYLFRTLHVDEATNERKWLYLMPLGEIVVYNLNIIESNPDMGIDILDNLSLVDGFKTEMSIVTYVGGNSYYKKYDWSIWSEKKFRYIFDSNNIHSVKKGVYLYSHFAGINQQLTYVHAVDNGSRTIQVEFDEFLRLAEEKFGLIPDYTPIKQKRKKYIYSEKIQKRKPREWIVEPLMHRGDIAGVFGFEKSGKTTFAMRMALMIATRKSLGNRLRVLKAFKTLYFDYEMYSEDGEQKIYVYCDNNKKIARLIDENFDYFNFIDEAEGNKDILSSEGKLWFEGIIDPYDVIFIDNLGEVFDGADPTPQSIRQFMMWLRYLAREKRKTFVFLHHFGDNGEPRGTRKLLDFIDLRIDISSLPSSAEEDHCCKVEIKPSRHLSPKFRESFIVRYSTLNNKKVENVTTVSGEKCNGFFSYVTDTEVEDKKLDVFHVEVLGYMRETSGPVKRSQLEKLTGKCGTTVLNCINELKEKGLVKDSDDIPYAYVAV